MFEKRSLFKWEQLVFISVLIHSYGCKSETATQEELVSIVDRCTGELKQALMTGKVEKRMTFYDDDAVLSPDGFPMIEGREQIRKFLTNGMAMAQFISLDFITQRVKGNHQYIQQLGVMNSEIIVNDSSTFDNSSKFFFIWKLQDDGSYKIAAEMYNNKNEDED